jgi:excisionase family DNA binding protein
MPKKSKAKAPSPPAAAPAGEILTRTEAANLTHINIQNIDRAIQREELRAYRPIGRKVLILREDLMKWILGAPMYEKRAHQ